jgi:hypothetical protein
MVSRWRLAWTITKLKVVRAVLSPILRWHVKREAKAKNEEHDATGL